MFKNLSKDPAKLLTVLLFLALIISCGLMVFSRGIADSCSCSLPRAACAQADPRTAIDTSRYADPDIKNNLDLVLWAENACDKGWGYVYGTWGNVLDESLLTTKAAQYPNNVGGNMGIIREKWMNGRVTDCVGLIKGYCWYSPKSGKFEYCANGMPDIGANALLKQAETSGEIVSMPDIPGLAVCAPDHIGVYIGGGWVIEAKSTADGVIKTRLEDRPWTHWCRISCITYLDRVEHYTLEAAE